MRGGGGDITEHLYTYNSYLYFRTGFKDSNGSCKLESCRVIVIWFIHASLQSPTNQSFDHPDTNHYIIIRAIILIHITRSHYSLASLAMENYGKTIQD